MSHKPFYSKRLTWLIILLTGCTIVNGRYTITPIDGKTYTPTHAIDILHELPQSTHRVIAHFAGHENDQCQKNNDFCNLKHQGQKIGAHAALIQKHSISQQPAKWIQVGGKMTKIHAYTVHYIEGIFIRYSPEDN